MGKKKEEKTRKKEEEPKPEAVKAKEGAGGTSRIVAALGEGNQAMRVAYDAEHSQRPQLVTGDEAMERETLALEVETKDSTDQGEDLDQTVSTLTGRRDGLNETVVEGSANCRFVDGKPIATRGIFRDVTERERAEEARRGSEELYRDLVETTGELVQSVAPDGSLIYANRAWRETLGYEEEDIPGLSLFDVIHPDSMEHCKEMFQRVMAGEKVKDIEARFVTKDGKTLLVEGSANCRFVDGEPVATHGIFRDVTERKRAEEELRESESNLAHAQRIAHVGNWKLHPRTGEVEASDELLTIFGLGRDDLTLSALADVVHPDDRKYDLDHIQRGIERGLPWDIEHRLLMKDGTVKWVHAIGEPHLDEHGKTSHIVGIVQDITEHKRAEETLRQRTHDLGERVKELVCLYSASKLMAELDKPLDEVLQSVVHTIPSSWQYPDVTCGRITLEGREAKTDNFKETPWKLAADIRVSEEKTGAVEVYYLDERPAADEGPFLEEERTLINALAREMGRFVVLKRAEEALRASENKYRTLLENLPQRIFLKDSDLVYVSCNENLARDLKIKPHEIAGKTDIELFPRELAEKYRADDARIIQTGKPEELEERYVQNGQETWVRTVKTPLKDEQGNVIGVLGIFWDITDRKRAEDALRASEEKYRNVVERANDGIVLIQDGVVRYTNARLTKMGGYAAEEVVGAQFIDFLDESERPRVLDYYRKRMSGQDVPSVYETALSHKDGEKVFVEINAGMTTYEGRPADLVFVRDITEHKQLEAQFLQAQKMEAVGRLAGGVAHDFNNLLTIITGYSALTLKDLDKHDPIRADIEGIERAAERAAGLTRQLLAFSRRQVLRPKVIDLNMVVAEMEKMLRRLIGEDVELTTVLGTELGHVKADPGQIEQVIMNLAVNARDAMPKGGKLTVETRNVELDEAYVNSHFPAQAGSYVMIAMSDTGCGMDEETRSHIFDPFFTTKEKGKGTGLGLSTVYGIVKQSGGYIWVYSEPGQGTTFKIYLPRVAEAVEAVKPSAAPGLEGGSETVVLVEDEDVVRTVALRILKRSGYAVLEARNGGEALLICEKHKEPIHLMITDVVMPGMSGPELFERLASLRPEMRVLFMSGYTDDAILRHGALEPGTEFIEKPFTPDGLARKVREVLDAPKEGKQ